MTEKLVITVASLLYGDHYDKVLVQSVAYYTHSLREISTNI